MQPCLVFYILNDYDKVIKVNFGMPIASPKCGTCTRSPSMQQKHNFHIFLVSRPNKTAVQSLFLEMNCLFNMILGVYHVLVYYNAMSDATNC